MAVTPAVATSIASSNSSATGLNPHRSLSGGEGAAWAARSSVRIRVVSEDTPRLGTMVQPMRRSSLFVVVLLAARPVADGRPRPDAHRATEPGRRHQGGGRDRPTADGLPRPAPRAGGRGPGRDRAAGRFRGHDRPRRRRPGAAFGRAAGARARVGRARPGAGERRGDAPDGRGVAGGGGAGLPDRAAGSDRPAGARRRAARSGRDDPGLVGRPRSRCRSRPPERGDARRHCRAVRVRRSRRHIGRRSAEQG